MPPQKQPRFEGTTIAFGSERIHWPAGVRRCAKVCHSFRVPTYARPSNMLVLGYISPVVRLDFPPHLAFPPRTGPHGVRIRGLLVGLMLLVQPALAAPTSPAPAASQAPGAPASTPPASAPAATPSRGVALPPSTPEPSPANVSASPLTPGETTDVGQPVPRPGFMLQEVVVPESFEDGVRRYVQARSGLNCFYHSHIVEGGRAAVACGSGGLLLLVRENGGWLAKERRPSNGDVVGFVADGERILVRVVRHQLQSLPGFTSHGRVAHSSPWSAAGAHSGPPRARVGPPEPESAQVMRVEGRDVALNKGRRHGFELGAHIAFEGQGQTPDVVGRLFGLKQDTARVRIGFGERVPLGATGYVTDARRTATRRSPLRSANYWELRGSLRPIVQREFLGGGLSGGVSVGYRGQRLHTFAVLEPFAWGRRSATDTEREFQTLDNGSVAFALGYAGASLDLRRFEVGMGIGFQTINNRGGESVPGTGLSFVPLLRVGALDGLHGRLRFAATIFRSEASFSWFDVAGQIPIVDGIWATVQAGGTPGGFASGEAGVRLLLSGAGVRGSTFLELTAGWTDVFERVCDGLTDCAEDNVAGPHLGAGVEFRL